MKLLNNWLKIRGVPETDFSIDASYEFANYIFNKGNGTRLTHVPEFCGFFTTNCVTYPKGFHACVCCSINYHFFKLINILYIIMQIFIH